MARFVYQGRFMEENVAIKNTWQKGRAIFLDLYFYRTQTSKLIDISFIKSLYDPETDAVYTDMEKFVDNFQSSIKQIDANSSSPLSGKVSDDDKTPANQLEDLKNELTILYFILRCNLTFVDVKLNSICDFIANRKNQDPDSCSQFGRTCLKHLNPTEEDFYQALDNMVKKPQKEALDLLHQALKISISDGGLNYSERLYLSEIIQTYRLHNIHSDIDF